MKFWDTSAIIPLIVDEQFSELTRALLEDDRELAVWWSTPVECASALARREREKTHSSADIAAAFGLLDELAACWTIVLPAPSIATTARRLVRVHPLRAADALQLAACIGFAGEKALARPIVCLDTRLRDAAAREGLVVLPAAL